MKNLNEVVEELSQIADACAADISDSEVRKYISQHFDPERFQTQNQFQDAEEEIQSPQFQ
jgi:hypothetical protein